MIYFLPNKTLHNITKINNEGAITLILTGFPVKQTCKLYTNKPLTEDKTLKTALNPHKLKTIMLDILNKIK